MYLALRRIPLGAGKYIEVGDEIDEKNWAARALRFHIRTNRIQRVTGTLEQFKAELRKTMRGYARDEFKKPSSVDAVKETKPVAVKAETTSGKKKKPKAAAK